MASLYYLPQYRSTTLSTVGGIDASQTTGITITAIPADLDITLPGIICVGYADPLVTTTAEYISYTSIDGTNTLVGATRGAEGYSGKTHSAGETVAWVVSKSHVNNINDKLRGVDATLALDTSGNEVIKTASVASAVNEITIKNAATGTFPKIQATGEADTGVIIENSESEEIIILDAIASAVNEVTIKNAVTGAGPIIEATGGDTNIDVNIQPKGTGALVVKGTSTASAEIRLSEDTDNGTNYVGIKAPASTANVTFTLPSADGTSGQALTTNGSGTLSFSTSGSTDGWTSSSDTLTYASASTFTIAGVDRTTTYTKGTKLKFTNTTLKYAVVASSSFSTDTTVTIYVNTDYVIANAAISSPSYSYQSNPQGFPEWFIFTASPTGFSSAPSLSTRYSIQGRKATITCYTTGGGTSNATTFTIGTPITAAASASAGAAVGILAVDNSAETLAMAYVIGGSSSITLAKGATLTGAWTASGNKYAYFTITFEI